MGNRDRRGREAKKPKKAKDQPAPAKSRYERDSGEAADSGTRDRTAAVKTTSRTRRATITPHATSGRAIKTLSCS